MMKLTARADFSRQAIAILIALLALPLSALPASPRPQSNSKDEEKRKKAEPFKIRKLTQGMGLYTIGPVSPDKRQVLLVAQKPEKAPNLYMMDVTDFSIRPALTSFQWGVSDPAWSPDGQSVAMAGFAESATFSELYALELKTAKLRQLTSNNFSDKEPVFSPDGKRLFFTTDESPLPDAAFGILHIASVAAAGGKPDYFTEDEASTIHPRISPDGKSLLLVKVDDASGRHTLWQYGFDGKPQRDLTGRKFARIHRILPFASGAALVLWAQEEAEQQDNVYIFDLKSGEARALPDPDLPKRTPAVSPGGTLVAFISPTQWGGHLFLFNAATGSIQQLTYKGANTHAPVFTSDDSILFGSDREKDNELYLINLAATNEEEKKKK